MQIVSEKLDAEQLRQMATERFGDMVKAVVDVERQVIAVDAELHSDLEALLLENGSKQKNLWGINLYPELSVNDLIEYDSMINVRPGQGNRSRSVENVAVQKMIIEIVDKRIAR